jgi:hypothetical protein
VVRDPDAAEEPDRRVSTPSFGEIHHDVNLREPSGRAVSSNSRTGGGGAKEGDALA